MRLALVSLTRGLPMRLKRMAQRAFRLAIWLLTLPLRRLIHGRVRRALAAMHELVRSADSLLDRPLARADPALAARLLQGRRVLITGAAGSIGSELARQVFGQRPAR